MVYSGGTNMSRSILLVISFVVLLSGQSRAASSYSSTSRHCVDVNATTQETPQELIQLVRKADELYKAGKPDEAITTLSKAAELYPRDYRPHLLMGFVYRAQAKFKSASESFATAIRLQPNEKDLYVLKVEVDQNRNAHDEALKTVQKVLELDPRFARGHMLLGSMLKWDPATRAQAIKAFETALEIDPTLYLAYEELGDVFREAKQENRAEELYRKGIEKDPKHMAGRFELGRMLVKQGRLEEARVLWNERTADDDQTFPQFITVLTRAESLKRATESLAQKPNDPDAQIEMGFAVMEGDHWVVDNRQERAIVYFRKALELKPNYARAQQAIVKAMIQRADTFPSENKKVDAEMKKLRDLDPKLADDMEQYRKTYKGGLIAAPPKEP
jgi:tetratricopeptide (TPR) repeat protein